MKNILYIFIGCVIGITLAHYIGKLFGDTVQSSSSKESQVYTPIHGYKQIYATIELINWQENFFILSYRDGFNTDHPRFLKVFFDEKTEIKEYDLIPPLMSVRYANYSLLKEIESGEQIRVWYKTGKADRTLYATRTTYNHNIR